ncbi:hypothetical protein [Phenylobacterium sp.]|uniref:hypothetical protein n=1 Tax=Phenylobacterium sp. TaxID=1871053 RepID=UPI003940B742
MTEDEAKAKWCPFARVATLQTTDHYGTVMPAGPVANRWTAGSKPTERIALCIGSACMAWRESRDIATNSETGISRAVVLGGYCGLAGEPQ